MQKSHTITVTQKPLVYWHYINGHKMLANALYQLVMCPGGVLGISSDGDDQRIFLGLKFSIPGLFWI